MPKSARLADKEAKKARVESRALDIARRGETHSCSKPDCKRPARHRGSPSNVTFVKKGAGTWGFRVRDGLVVEPEQEILRILMRYSCAFSLRSSNTHV
jgi:hypothetical protein